jgi:hypothetical protein
MNLKTRLTLLAVVIGLSSPAQLTRADVWTENSAVIEEQTNVLVSSRETGTAPDINKRDAKPGDVAAGTVLITPGGELHLNIRPCEVQPFVVVFRQPYSRATRGQKNCAGQVVTIEQIQQN